MIRIVRLVVRNVEKVVAILTALRDSVLAGPVAIFNQFLVPAQQEVQPVHYHNGAFGSKAVYLFD